jgi:hypothetical protein
MRRGVKDGRAVDGTGCGERGHIAGSATEWACVQYDAELVIDSRGSVTLQAKQPKSKSLRVKEEEGDFWIGE